jgi:hypothetical protein
MKNLTTLVILTATRIANVVLVRGGEMLKKIIKWFMGTGDFKPRVIFNIYCYFIADCTIAELLKADPSGYVNGDMSSSLMRLAHKNETNILIYAHYLHLKGSVMSCLFSWWWVVYSDDYYKTLNKGVKDV